MSVQYNSTSIIVDDTDSSITYSSGWVLSGSSAEYDQTYHGATKAGMTATFTFTGVSIAVYGSQGSYDVYGRPVTSYTIDGDNLATYQAPIIDPPYYTAHTLFFQSPPLSPGTHTLVITNLNGTAPSEYWLDYIIYTPGDATQSTPSAPATTPSSPSPTPTAPGTSAPPTSSFPSPSSPNQIPSSNPTAPSSTSAGPSAPSSNASVSSLSGSPVSSSGSSAGFTSLVPISAASSSGAVNPSAGSGTSASDLSPTAISAAATSSKTPTGAIAGGVVGGVAGLALLLLLLFFVWRRMVHRPNGDDLRPFASWRNDPAVPKAPVVFRKSPLPSSPPDMSMMNSTSSPPSESVTGTGYSQPMATSEPTSVIIHQHADSGVRIPLTEQMVVDIPPAYTHN